MKKVTKRFKFFGNRHFGEADTKEEWAMERDTICKTIHQYSRGPIPEADMEKPQAIARDYKKVKNYI